MLNAVMTMTNCLCGIIYREVMILVKWMQKCTFWSKHLVRGNSGYIGFSGLWRDSWNSRTPECFNWSCNIKNKHHLEHLKLKMHFCAHPLRSTLFSQRQFEAKTSTIMSLVFLSLITLSLFIWGLFFQIGNWINNFEVLYTSDVFVFAKRFRFI